MHQRTDEPSNTRNEPTADDVPLPLHPRQLAAIDLLFGGETFSSVANLLGVNRKTVFRWRQTPLFIAEIRRRYQHRAARKPLRYREPLIPARNPEEPGGMGHESTREKRSA